MTKQYMGALNHLKLKVVKAIIVLYENLGQNTTKDEKTIRSTTRKIDPR